MEAGFVLLIMKYRITSREQESLLSVWQHLCFSGQTEPCIIVETVLPILLYGVENWILSPLLFATHDWSCYLDKGLSVAAVFFDLSKAFDKVPHCQLLSALANVGVSGSLLNWFRSYLSNRSQRVVLDGYTSEVHPVTSGVPQGSILGPLLFSIYVNSLTKIPLCQDSTMIMYADDIVLYKPITSSCDVDALQSDINKVAEWISNAGLCLNANKSKVVVFSRKNMRPAVVVAVDSTIIPNVDSICFLGVTVSSDLK